MTDETLVERLRARRCVNAYGLGTAFADPLSQEAADRLSKLEEEKRVLVHELRYVESVYRQNCVEPREPSSLLEGVQKLLAKYEYIK